MMFSERHTDFVYGAIVGSVATLLALPVWDLATGAAVVAGLFGAGALLEYLTET